MSNSKIFNTLSGLIDVANYIDEQYEVNNNALLHLETEGNSLIVYANEVSEKSSCSGDVLDIEQKLKEYIETIENLSATILCNSKMSAFFSEIKNVIKNNIKKSVVDEKFEQISNKISDLNDIDYIEFNPPSGCKNISLSAYRFDSPSATIISNIKSLKFNGDRFSIVDSKDKDSLSSSILLWKVEKNKKYDYIAYEWQDSTDGNNAVSIGMINAYSEFPIIYKKERNFDIPVDTSLFAKVDDKNRYLKKNQLSTLLSTSILSNYLKTSDVENRYFLSSNLSAYASSAKFEEYATKEFANDRINEIENLSSFVDIVHVNVDQNQVEKGDDIYKFEIDLYGANIQRYYVSGDYDAIATGKISIKAPFDFDNENVISNIELHIPLSSEMTIDFGDYFENALMEDDLSSAFENSKSNVAYVVYDIKTLKTNGNWKSYIKYDHMYYESDDN